MVDSAWLEHGPFAFWLIDRARPRMLVELGTHNGFSYLAFCQAVQRLGLSTACYAVDTWLGDAHAGFYGEEIYARLGTLNHQNYAGFSSLLRCRFDEALPYFANGSIDLLHIDGRHSYEDVRADFESWQPKLSARGVVLFHDLNVRERDFGVWRLWLELAAQYPSFQFIHGHGLGVLAVGPDVPDALFPLFRAPADETDRIRLAYARLGQAVTLQFVSDQAHFRLGEIIPECDRLRAEQHAAKADSERLSGELDAQRAGFEKLRLEHDAILAETEKQLADLQASRAENERLSAAHHAGAAENERLRAEQQANATEQRAGATENDGLRAEQRASAADKERLLAELFAARSAEQVARAHVVQIERSTIWQASWPVRTALGKTSVPLRRLLRRGARAVWWAATPHRIPRRLRERAASGAVMIAPAENKPAPEVIAAPAKRFLAFQPAGGMGSDALIADRNGRYVLTDAACGYVYVPPERPANFTGILDGLSARPLFSIVVPIYNTAPDLLARMLSSVQAQWYPDWELILSDDASPGIDTQKALARINHPQIRVKKNQQNGGISLATNSGLAEAQGDYVVFLDHDDELTADCLYELARCIAETNADFIYSDEDKIDSTGQFTQPFFKPDWSPEALMSTMYTCHVSCVRRSLLEAVGPLRPEYDGSQDWDLILRVSEQAEIISHIAKVLYHWRIIPASLSSDITAKPYAVNAGRLAREAALERRGWAGSMEPVPEVPGYFRARYTPRGTPLVSIIIPSRDNGEVLARCLDSLRQVSAWRAFEVLVIDNGSIDAKTIQSLQDLAERDEVRVIRHDAPFNWAELNNLGSREAQGELLLFLNDDTELVSADGLDRMIGYAQLPHIGAVGAKLLYPQTRQVQHAGVVNLAGGPNHAFLREHANAPGYFMRNLLEYNWIAVTGACLLIERSKFVAAGGFDESFPIAYNDVELCFRLYGNGLFHVVCPSALWLHHESLTRGLDDQDATRFARLMADKQRLYLKHPAMLMHDPFHNPNLSPDGVQFEIAI